LSQEPATDTGKVQLRLLIVDSTGAVGETWAAGVPAPRNRRPKRPKTPDKGLIRIVCSYVPLLYIE
jgi:hypothetical protein